MRLTRLWPYAALTLLAALAAEPLAHGLLLCSDDGAFHLYRAVELGSLLRLGHWFPRWAPHMAQGYGYPFFNFYAPLSSYVVVALNALGLPYPAALHAAFALALWLAGVGAYAFARDRWGQAAGVAAGAAYLLAPYLAYDVLFRANLAESFAFVWPPLVLCALGRMARAQRDGHASQAVRWGLAAALAYAALILTHNIFALIASPLFAGYAALLVWTAGPPHSLRQLLPAAAALAAGIGLAAYFWVPALAERGLVHSDRLFVPPIFTWYTNFISAGELLALPRAEDPLLLNPSPPRAVGVVPVLLFGLPGVAAALRGLAGRRRAPGCAAPHAQTLFFVAALAVYAVLTLPLSRPVWALITPLELVQFPWRMLGPAALCAAAVIAAGVRTLELWAGARPGAVRAAPAAAAVLVIAGASLGWWYPRYCAPLGTASVADLVAYERDTFTIGTTAKGEYLPRTAPAVPADTALAQSLLAGHEPARLLLPEGHGTITSPTAADPLDAVYTVNVTQPTTAVYRQFAYPGWRVSVDGQPAGAGITAEGLLAFGLAPGTHTVRVWFGLTPLRAAAAGISLLTLAAVAGAAALAWRRAAGAEPAAEPAPRPAGAVLLAACAGLLVIKWGLIDRVPNPLRRPALDPASQQVTTAAHPLRADVAGGVRLHGYDVWGGRVPSGGGVDAALYASVREPVAERFWPHFTVEDAAGLPWSDPDSLPPRWHREPPHTPLWPLDHYAQWARHVTLLPGTPPGDYTLYGSVFSLDTLATQSLLDETGSAAAPRLALANLTVTRPARPLALAPPHAAEAAFGPLALLGYDLDREAANAGERLLLTLFWRAAARPEADYTAHVALLGPDGEAVMGLDVPPANGYATSQWQAGDQWRGQHRLRLPATLEAGEYVLAVSVPGAGQGEARLGRLRVSAPARVFEPPPFAQASGAEFAGVGVLEGYSLAASAEAVQVELVWRALASPETSLSVFVHLADSTGRVWAQSDTVPAQWTRPTTGWVAGEYVTDPHRLPLPAGLPAGEYTLWVGLYDPATGQRVPAAGSGAAGEEGRARLQTLTLGR